MTPLSPSDRPAWNIAASYAVLRVTLGVAFLFHGVTRFVNGVSAFADQMVQTSNTRSCRPPSCGPLP